MPSPVRLVQWLIIWFCILGVTCANGVVLPGYAQTLTEDPLTSSAQSSIKRWDLDSNNIPSEKVNQFVQACLQVITLIERREGNLQGAVTEAEATRIEQAIEADALAVIERNGLTRQEYLQLLGLANTDPEFGERVAIQLQEISVE